MEGVPGLDVSADRAAGIPVPRRKDRELPRLSAGQRVRSLSNPSKAWAFGRNSRENRTGNFTGTSGIDAIRARPHHAPLCPIVHGLKPARASEVSGTKRE